MAYAERREDKIIVDTQWNERELIKRVPSARWDTVYKHWTTNLTWAACVQLRGVFADRLTIGPELTDWAWTQRSFVERQLDLRNRIEPNWGPWDTRLYPFQEVGRRFMSLGREAILADEMGTGKTVQVLSALDMTRELPALVVCPNSVKRSWAEHTKTWCGADVHPYVVTGTATQRARIIKDAATDPNAVIIINYEQMRLLSRLAPYGSVRLKRCRACDPRGGEDTLPASRCEVHPKELNRIPFRTVIVDEAHRIKDPSSKQTRAVWAVAHGPAVSYRWLLTGTPLANHPGDLWSLLHCASPLEFPTKTHYVDRYCLQSWNAFGGLDIVGINPATRDEFLGLLDPRFRRMLKAVVLTQLPPKVRSIRYVDLSPKQSRAYRELENGLGILTPGGPLFAPNPLVLRTRLMQFSSATCNVNTNGSDDVSQWEVELTDPSSKIDDLMDCLEELGDKQVAICAQSRKLIDLVAKRLEKYSSFGMITGTVPEYERQVALRQFQEHKLQYLLFTIAAGGVGLTMTAADTIIFLQRSDSMIDNKQAEDRVHRVGSEVHESVYIIDIVAKDTVEERQIEILHEKLQRLDEITRDRARLGERPEFDEEENAIMAVRL